MNGIILKPFSILSSPFDAPFRYNRVVLSTHSARARVGLHGSFVGPKMAQNHFLKLVPRSTGVLKQVYAPQLQKALKMGFLVSKIGQKWVKNAVFQNDN